MGLSPQDYRIRIGNFNCQNVKQTFKIKSKPTKSISSKLVSALSISLALVLILNCFFLPNNKHYQEMIRSRDNSNILPCNSNFKLKVGNNQDLYQSINFCWSHSVTSTNKMQKIINGKRRIVGYKIAAWNCSRGLVQDGFSNKHAEI